MKTLTSTLALLCFVAVACEEQKAPSTEAPVAVEPAVKVAPAAVKKVEPPPIALDTIPTEEAFEEEAASAVTPVSLEKELDSLEKEMSSE